MPIAVQKISSEQAAKVILTEEGQFSDVKGIDIGPAKLTKFISALANTDGGDIQIGISEIGKKKQRKWHGFVW